MSGTDGRRPVSVLRGGLIRLSEATELRWGDVELQEDGKGKRRTGARWSCINESARIRDS